MMVFHDRDRHEVEMMVRYSTPAGREIDRLRQHIRELRKHVPNEAIVEISKEIVP